MPQSLPVTTLTPDQDDHSSTSPLSTRASLSPASASGTSSATQLTQPSSITPLLTPNTRAEAEEALSSNSFFQTSAAAPSTTEASPVAPIPSAGRVGQDDAENESDDINHETEAPAGRLRGKSIGRPTPHPRLGTSNYADAVRAAAAAALADAEAAGDAEPGSAGYLPGLDGTQGQKAGDVTRYPVRIERQQSWNVEDMKRMMIQKVMEDGPEGRAGYHSVETEY